MGYQQETALLIRLLRAHQDRKPDSIIGEAAEVTGHKLKADAAGFFQVSDDGRVIKDGRWCAGLCVRQRPVGELSAREIEFVQEVANSTWDAVERSRAMTALRESEALFREIAEVAPILIWMSDSTKACTWFNKPWLEFTGRTMEQELGFGWAEGVHPEDFERCLATYNTAFDRREPFRMDYRLKRSDGAWRIVNDIGVQRFASDGSFLGYIGSCLDVTDQRALEEALRQGEERFRGIFEHAATGIAISAMNGRLQSCNPAFSSMLGYSEEELKEFTIADLQHPGDRGAVLEKIEALVTGRIPSFEISSRHIGKGGKPIWVNKYVSLLKDGNDRPTSIMALVTNLTESKRAEAAQELARAKSQFLANVSHELRTPMTGIIGFNELLLQTELTSQQKEYAELIHSSAGCLLSLIDDILDLEKIERGAMDINIQPVLLGELISAVKPLEVIAANKSLQFKVACELPKNTMLYGDLPRIRQILTNLLGNAMKFTAEGEVALSIAREFDSLRFTIADTGCGIPDQDLAAIFDWFYRSEGCHSCNIQGSGLGLPIAKELAGLMGGKISVTSEIGRGTRFMVLLPLFTAEFSPQHKS